MNVLNQHIGKDFAIYNGDCVEVIKGIPDKSIDYSLFSPPFCSLFTYSNSPRDMGNSRTDEQFFQHFDYLIAELKRVLKPGHNLSFHCMLLPTSKEKDGYIGLKDFRGDLIRAFQKHGFIFASEVVIWKDPVTAMQRTKALGLLHKTIIENSCMSRQGIPDYLITMRAPGEMVDRVKHYRTTDEMMRACKEKDLDPAKEALKVLTVDEWQKLASPVWMDINQSDTLQHKSAREHDDERHVCPLQLEVIRRGVKLWTNPGDVVLSPFGGIGSEGYASLQLSRKYIGIELKESYYKQACLNLENASRTNMDLFA